MDGEGFGDIGEMEKQQDLADSPLEDQWFEPGGSGEDAREAGGFVRLKRQNALVGTSAIRRAAKRPAKRPARYPSPSHSDQEEDDGELDIGGYLLKKGMDYRQQILYCRAYASMLAAKLKAEGRRTGNGKF